MKKKEDYTIVKLAVAMTTLLNIAVYIAVTWGPVAVILLLPNDPWYWIVVKTISGVWLPLFMLGYISHRKASADKDASEAEQYMYMIGNSAPRLSLSVLLFAAALYIPSDLARSIIGIMILVILISCYSSISKNSIILTKANDSEVLNQLIAEVEGEGRQEGPSTSDADKSKKK